MTRELAEGRFEPGAGFRFPFRFRHGSVLPLSAAEFARLRSASWAKRPATEPAPAGP